ncbi:ROK family transcriptional regulator [Bacillus sp. SD088]|uniref:ROK family transcriptional regulator n=1 Tax=Bacillus sp. SD088 TaxID=2782012 RepID=UPI001F617B14|nr:ROK family transcriptional regulator [Bacillus sp. SD088]
MVLNTIRKEGPISKSEIAKRHHLSLTTVTSAVNHLIQDGLVYEEQPGASSGGRKPILLHFSSNRYFIVCLSISNTAITVGKLDLNPRIINKVSFDAEERKGIEYIDFLLSVADAFFNKMVDKEKCIGISLVAPGIVDYGSGIIRYNSKLMLKDVRLKQIFEEKFNIKTWLDNDSNAAVLAEKEIGDYQDYKNILYVILSDGVGAGIVLNNSLFRGHKGGAGEFGHTIVESNGIRCECGNKGCLESYVSWPAIHSRIYASIGKREYSKMIELVSG